MGWVRVKRLDDIDLAKIKKVGGCTHNIWQELSIKYGGFTVEAIDVENGYIVRPDLEDLTEIFTLCTDTPEKIAKTKREFQKMGF